MKLTKITPRGFCKGVVDAWMMAKKVSENNPNRKIYMIGWIVHNKNMIDEIEKLNIVTLDDKNTSRWDLIKSIDIKEKPIVIFSAHGTDPKLIQYAKNIGLEVYDATCVYVTNIQKLIQQKINDGFQIVYIGVKNHAETISIMSIDKNINLISNPNDVDNLNIIDDKIFVTNQTTISIYEFYDVVKKLKTKYQNIEFKNDICNAAKERQDAIINMDKSIDVLIVVGDKKSNNTRKLYELGIKQNIDTYYINSVKELDTNWFKNKQHIGITSGCSTPTWTTNSIINKIEEYINNGK